MEISLQIVTDNLYSRITRLTEIKSLSKHLTNSITESEEFKDYFIITYKQKQIKLQKNAQRHFLIG